MHYNPTQKFNGCVWCRDVRLLSLFRFTIWWMIPRMGNSASDIPIETQMLLLEASEKEKGPTSDDASTSYILFLPVLDGEFRSSLQGNSSNELEFCIESGKITSIIWNKQSHIRMSISYIFCHLIVLFSQVIRIELPQSPFEQFLSISETIHLIWWRNLWSRSAL